jgi:hypothetical protein
MQKTKLVTLLRTFSKQEMKDFGKFISSPYFASGRNIKPLYNILKKYHPKFDSPHFTDEKIFKKINPGKKYESSGSGRSFRVLLSEMFVSAEKFLQVQNILNKGSFKKIILLEEFRRRKLYESFNSSGKKFTKSFESGIIGESFFLWKYLFDYENISLIVYAQKKDINHYLEKVKNCEDSLISYFVSEYKKYFIARRANYYKSASSSALGTIFNECFDYSKFIDRAIGSVSDENFQTKILFFCAKLEIDSEDSRSYEALKTLLKTYENRLSYFIHFPALVALSNFGIKRFFSSKYYANDSMNLQEKCFILAVNSRDPEFIFNSVFTMQNISSRVLNCYILGLNKKLEKFINKYSGYFNPKIKKDAINFAEGVLAFLNCNFEKSLQILSMNKTPISLILREIKHFKMQACYEQNYFELLYSEIDSYKHFLLNKPDIPEDRKEADREFMKLLNQLVRLKQTSDSKERELQIKSINYQKILRVRKQWVLEKIKELK